MLPGLSAGIANAGSGGKQSTEWAQASVTDSINEGRRSAASCCMSLADFSA